MAEIIDFSGNPAGSEVRILQRLGKNHGGYKGEQIDIAGVLANSCRAAASHGWREERIQAAPGLEIVTLVREARPGRAKGAVYISAGIHGDEPAGPLAMERLLTRNAWPPEMDLWICPCLNPTGFVANRRENAAGTDLNRQYLQPKAEEIIAHIAWLERQPRFDLCLALHEDWESHGFYLYELNPDRLPSLAETMISRVRTVCPVDPSDVIEGRPSQGGIIRPTQEHLRRTEWPEAFFLLRHKTRLSYTLEAPSDFPLPVRVEALTVAVQAALEEWRSA